MAVFPAHAIMLVARSSHCANAPTGKGCAGIPSGGGELVDGDRTAVLTGRGQGLPVFETKPADVQQIIALYRGGNPNFAQAGCYESRPIFYAYREAEFLIDPGIRSTTRSDHRAPWRNGRPHVGACGGQNRRR